MKISHALTLFATCALSLCPAAQGMFRRLPIALRPAAIRHLSTQNLSAHYKTLGVLSNANRQEIDAAYRKQLIKTHPDVTGRDSRSEHDEVKEAYKKISEKHKDPIKWEDQDLKQNKLYYGNYVNMHENRSKDTVTYTIKNKKIVGMYTNKRVENANFATSSFQNTQFQETDFQDVIIKDSELTNTAFTDLTFNATQILNGEVTGGTFKNVTLNGANLEGTQFKNTTFTNMILTGNFKNTRFINCTFNNVTFAPEAQLEGASFYRSQNLSWKQWFTLWMRAKNVSAGDYHG